MSADTRLVVINVSTYNYIVKHIAVHVTLIVGLEPEMCNKYQSKTIRGNYDYDRELSSIVTVPVYILSKFYVFGQGKCQLSVLFSAQQICHVLRKTTCTISGS